MRLFQADGGIVAQKVVLQTSSATTGVVNSIRQVRAVRRVRMPNILPHGKGGEYPIWDFSTLRFSARLLR